MKPYRQRVGRPPRINAGTGLIESTEELVFDCKGNFGVMQPIVKKMRRTRNSIPSTLGVSLGWWIGCDGVMRCRS
jgi:hypothetical protein